MVFMEQDQIRRIDISDTSGQTLHEPDRKRRLCNERIPLPGCDLFLRGLQVRSEIRIAGHPDTVVVVHKCVKQFMAEGGIQLNHRPLVRIRQSTVPVIGFCYGFCYGLRIHTDQVPENALTRFICRKAIHICIDPGKDSLVLLYSILVPFPVIDIQTDLSSEFPFCRRILKTGKAPDQKIHRLRLDGCDNPMNQNLKLVISESILRTLRAIKINKAVRIVLHGRAFRLFSPCRPHDQS